MSSTDRMTIPESQTHRILIGFRAEISIGFFLEFCYDYNPLSIEIEENQGLVCTVQVDNNALSYIQDYYGFAIEMMCDLEQGKNADESEEVAA